MTDLLGRQALRQQAFEQRTGFWAGTAVRSLGDLGQECGPTHGRNSAAWSPRGPAARRRCVVRGGSRVFRTGGSLYSRFCARLGVIHEPSLDTPRAPHPRTQSRAAQPPRPRAPRRRGCRTPPHRPRGRQKIQLRAGGNFVLRAMGWGMAMQVASSALAAARGIESIGEAASRSRQESALRWSRTSICVAVADSWLPGSPRGRRATPLDDQRTDAGWSPCRPTSARRCPGTSIPAIPWVRSPSG